MLRYVLDTTPYVLDTTPYVLDTTPLCRGHHPPVHMWITLGRSADRCRSGEGVIGEGEVCGIWLWLAGESDIPAQEEKGQPA